ncbi:MAG: hypothetical protein M0R17_13735 [Candidatus Omnitrophica bacterium]|jgi:hypothetical protein|nr:hypothetical protein [Candidatus Omnitrophota bacterium]MDD5253221.1 hypothetical protein [Candidatus Omnitrophota bacterium]
MDKKEIYEHLANIYLDASSKSSKKKRRSKAYPKPIRTIILVGLLMVLGLGSGVAYSHLNYRNHNAQIALFLYQDAAKINFNFDPAKKETFSLELKHLNLSKYKTLSFATRKTNPRDILALRIEFVNRFNEKSEIYVKDIQGKWTNHTVDLTRFAKINNWEQMKTLSFSVEEWNAKEKSGIVYIDNIKVTK